MAKKVCVALSGGIDSCFCAYLLKNQGYELTGIILKIPFLDQDNLSRAEKICRHLRADFHAIPAEKVFEKKVIKYFIDAYCRGLTPNPCAVCNQFIKFPLLIRKAKKLGCDFLATGHYARVIREDKNIYLAKGKDAGKSQEYFLSLIRKNVFKNLLFPLGDYLKKDVSMEVRRIFPWMAAVDESQEICFIPGRNYRNFIEARISSGGNAASGRVKHVDGTLLGYHQGIWKYTCGQRVGLFAGINGFLYVNDIDPLTNTVFVAEREYILKDKFWVRDINWFYPRGSYNDLKVKLRYNTKLIDCGLCLREGKAVCELREGRSVISPGQVAAFYDREKVALAGIISREP